jgi:hypothetical protein
MMIKQIRPLFAFFLLFGLVAQAQLPVNILNSQFTTYVNVPGEANADTETPNFYTTPRTMMSAFPVSDGITNYVSNSDGSIRNNFGQPWQSGNATASADVFDVNAAAMATAPSPYDVYAEASSQIWFSPLASQNQMLSIQIVNLDLETDGQISLMDLTSNTELWLYNYGEPYNGGNLQFTSSDLNVNVETYFSSSDVYELSIEADCNDNFAGAGYNDSIQFTGLDVVPEPDVLSLVGLGSLASLVTLRRSK